MSKVLPDNIASELMQGFHDDRLAEIDIRIELANSRFAEAKANGEDMECRTCHGHGVIEVRDVMGSGDLVCRGMPRAQSCYRCKGTGKISPEAWLDSELDFWEKKKLHILEKMH